MFIFFNFVEILFIISFELRKELGGNVEFDVFYLLGIFGNSCNIVYYRILVIY